MNREEIISYCKKKVFEKLEALNSELKELQNSMENETKSSVGDKHEVGSAMLHLEAEKLGQQLMTNEQHLEVLNKIELTQIDSRVSFGSFVVTDKGSFFISSALGMMDLSTHKFFALSPAAPLAKEMTGLQTGEQFKFNGNTFRILNVL
ncbi:MAG: hypothetical protein MRY83_16295 [Flavobacteriales bacterium]|nr:hypothetical protein [Flavobacteriales bacterium]